MSRAAVTIAAFQLVLGTPQNIAPRSMGRGSVFISNNGPNAIFLGPTNAVTTATGFPVPAGDSIEIDDAHGDIWATVLTATQVTPADTRVMSA